MGHAHQRVPHPLFLRVLRHKGRRKSHRAKRWERRGASRTLFLRRIPTIHPRTERVARGEPTLAPIADREERDL